MSLLARAALFGCLVLPALAQSTADVFLVPFSHLDYFWGGTREECLARGNRIIARAIAVADRYPEFRFLIEDNDFLANYVDTHPGSAEVAALKRLVKQGRIEIAPKWAAIYQNLPDGEAQVRNFALGKRYARAEFGVDPQVAHMGDLPGYAPQMPQILAKSGIRSMVMTRMGPTGNPLFQWRAPDGTRSLVWAPAAGYTWGIRYGFHSEISEARRAAFLKDVAAVKAATPGPIYVSWGSDLWAPNEKIVENVAALNKQGGVKIVIATPSEFFASAAKSASIPELAGEVPSSWPNLSPSLPHMWPLIIPATNTLLNAEKFAALNQALGTAAYPRGELDLLWRKLLEAMDHNQDGQGGMAGDERKIGYMRHAILHGGEILGDMLRNIAERVRLPIANSHALVVFNPNGWERTDVVKAHMALFGDVSPADIADYKRGMRLVDETGKEIPFHVERYSENISRSLDIVFVAAGIPAMGYRTFFLKPAAGEPAPAKACTIKLDSDTDDKQPRRPLGSDVLENRFYRVSVDKATGRVSVFDKALKRAVVDGMEMAGVEERGGNYIGIEPLTGREIPNSGIAVAVEENNAVRAVVRITGNVAGVAVAQRLTLYAALKRLDIENTVEWNAPRLMRLQQVFPLASTDTGIHYGVPFGANASTNILPGAGPHLGDEITKEMWAQSRDIQHWIWAGNQHDGFTLAADHPQVKLTGKAIRAEMVRGTRFTSVRVVEAGRNGSLQYPPAGRYVFRYSLSSGEGDWMAAKAWQHGMDFNNELLPVNVLDDVSPKSLPTSASLCTVSGEGLVVSALKKADAGERLVLRVYEIRGAAAKASVTLNGKPVRLRDADLLEQATGAAAGELAVRPHEIKTLVLEP